MVLSGRPAGTLDVPDTDPRRLLPIAMSALTAAAPTLARRALGIVTLDRRPAEPPAPAIVRSIADVASSWLCTANACANVRNSSGSSTPDTSTRLCSNVLASPELEALPTRRLLLLLLLLLLLMLVVVLLPLAGVEATFTPMSRRKLCERLDKRCRSRRKPSRRRFDPLPGGFVDGLAVVEEVASSPVLEASGPVSNVQDAAADTADTLSDKASASNRRCDDDGAREALG